MSRWILVTILAFSLTGVTAWAQQAENLGAHRFGGMDEFQKVIETKCTVCHTRERVDIAIKKRQNLEDIEKRMIGKGAKLSEKDKSVLGTFWGNPLKGAGEKAPPSGSLPKE